MRWYHKFPKYSDTKKICCNHSKIWTMWLYHRVMSPNDADGTANSVDPDQTARSSLIWVCTVCPGISVRKLRIITVIDFWVGDIHVDKEKLFKCKVDEKPKSYSKLKKFLYKTGNILKRGGCLGAFACKSVSVTIQSLLFLLGCDRDWKIQCSFTEGAETLKWEKINLKPSYVTMWLT